MALLTDRKFIHFNRKSDFEAVKCNAISDKQIVFLKDAQEIWTHGTYYGSVEQFLDETNKDSTNAVSAAAVYQALADDEEVIAAALNDLNDKYTNLDSSKQDVISDLDTIRENAQSGASKVSNVQADWDATSGLAQILHKPDLSVYENKVTSVNGQTGAVVISDATTTTNGLMSSNDKIKLNELKNSVKVFNVTASSFEESNVAIDWGDIKFSTITNAIENYDVVKIIVNLPPADGFSQIISLYHNETVSVPELNAFGYCFTSIDAIFGLIATALVLAKDTENEESDNITAQLLKCNISNKQDAISDLNDIRNNAEEGSQAWDALSNYQELLVSGKNIKTINDESILQKGNISIYWDRDEKIRDKYENQYLTFEIVEPGTIEWQFNGGSKYASYKKQISYNINDQGWNTTDATNDLFTIGTFEVGDIIQFKGNASNYGQGLNLAYNYFSGTASFNIYGNILSLRYNTNELSSYRNSTIIVRNLFEHTNAINAKNLILPYVTISACYCELFFDCKKLISAPELPAPIISGISCYKGMFSNCTNLEIGPKILARSIQTGVENCNYSLSSMFSGCTKLKLIYCLLESVDVNNTTTFDNFTKNVASTGTFCADINAEWPTGTNGIPVGWQVCTPREFLENVLTKVNNIENNAVTSVNGMTGAVTIEIPENQLSNNYSPSTLINENLILEAGDTYEEAFGKLEKSINDNEQITAAALTDLDSRINTLHLPQSLDDIPDGSTRKLSDYATTTQLATKQDTLISGTNIKTINNQSLLGTGNINISNIEIIEVNANIRADVTKDGTITVDDTTALVKNLNTTNLQYDLNNDGQVTIADVTLSTNIAVNKPHNLYIDIETNPYSLITTSFNNSKIPILRLVFPGNQIKDILIQKTNNTPVYYGEDIYAIQIPSSGNGIDLSKTVQKIFVQISETEANGIIGHIVTKEGLSTKQDTLVSGTNIKTINNQSLLGEGNITIEGGGDTNIIETVKVNGTALTPDANKAVDITVPAAVTESTVSGWGFTKNAGTVTGVKMNGTTNNPTSGVVDLGTVITEHQDISGKANKNGSFNEEFNVSALNIDADGEQINLWADYNSQEKEVTLDITESNGGCHLKYIFDESGDTKYIATTDDLPTKTSDLTNDSGFLTTHQSIKSLNTNNTSAQTASASETIAGSGTINLHKVSKTGSYNDLNNKPTIVNNYVTGGRVDTSDGTIILSRSGLGELRITGMDDYVNGVTDDKVSKTGDTMTGALTISADTANALNVIGGSAAMVDTKPVLNVGTTYHQTILKIFDDGTPHAQINGTLEVSTSDGFAIKSTVNLSSDTGFETNGKIIGSAFQVSGHTNQNLNELLLANGRILVLPTFSGADNGKILGIQNGQLAWITPTTIYTGSGTPSSSQGNNGDIYLQTS